MQTLDFNKYFETLWGHDPFSWQRMLAERLVEDEWPRVLDLPNAAGKTACIAFYALAALADKPVRERTAPRRMLQAFSGIRARCREAGYRMLRSRATCRKESALRGRGTGWVS